MPFNSYIKLTASGDRPSLEFEVLSFRIGETVRQFRDGGGGIGAGAPTFAPLVVIKRMDKSSPELWETSITGRHLPSAVLSVSPKTSSVSSIKWSLGDVLITSIQVNGADHGDSAPLEEVTFTYRMMKIEFISSD
jgi:type VI secretion system Hcp family effector